MVEQSPSDETLGQAYYCLRSPEQVFSWVPSSSLDCRVAAAVSNSSGGVRIRHTCIDCRPPPRANLDFRGQFA
jgi:hypothetical protein